MDIDIDAVGNKIKGTTIIVEDPSSSSPPNHCFFLALPAELLDKILTINDHDSLQNMSFTSKQMRSIVKPYLMAKRKQLLDELCNFRTRPGLLAFTNLEWCKAFIGHEEESLKCVLRTNLELTCSAHDLPIEWMQQALASQIPMAQTNDAYANSGAPCSSSMMQVRASSSSAAGGQAHRACPNSGLQIGEPNNPFSVLEMLGLTEGRHDDQLAVEQRAYQLLQIALRHCNKFSEFYNETIAPAINNTKCHQLMSKDSVEAFLGGFAYRIFESFLRKYPVLSLFTDVHWPDKMPQAARQRRAVEYAQQNAKKCKKRRKRHNPYAIRLPRFRRHSSSSFDLDFSFSFSSESDDGHIPLWIRHLSHLPTPTYSSSDDDSFSSFDFDFDRFFNNNNDDGDDGC